ncbi:MAG: hypothetical protein J0M20_01390 [Burkholderiales bacterium]|nr:hypothetical protein [Burkholderiales bacterium]
MATSPNKRTPRTPEADKAAAEKADYTVLSRLEHDGELYEEGDQITLTAGQAAPLLGHTLQPAKAAAT